MRRLLLLAVAGLLMSPTGAWSQPAKRDVQIKAQGDAKIGRRAKRAEATRPALRGEQFVRRRTERMADAKWREAFNLLKKLIKSTPDSDRARPDLFYRLSEMYWERASANDIQAFDQEEACIKAAAGAQAAEGRCVVLRRRQEAASQKYRDDAIKIYKHIVRTFPNYTRMDEVLFALAYNYQQKGQSDGAKRIYIELIKRYPRSVHVPDTLLNIGELFFDEGKVEQAAKAYKKVTTNYKDAGVYGYALYKLGWCYRNLGAFEQALRTFIAVVEHTNEMDRRHPGRTGMIRLRKEALRDLVRTYVHLDNAAPTRAIGFFRKLAPDSYVDLSEQLAEGYADAGKWRQSTTLYRALIKLQAGKYRVVSYQIAIVENQDSTGKQVAVVKALKRLSTLWSKSKGAQGADAARVAKDGRRIEDLLRGKATEYHLQSRKTKSDEDYAIAYDLYSAYVHSFPEGENAYTMTFYFGELLYNLRKWKQAAQQYERTLEINPKGEFTEDAAHATVLAYKKLLMRAQPDAPVGDLGGEAPDAVKDVPEPKAIPEDYQRYLKAIEIYKKYVAKSPSMVDILYDEARVYYDFDHFDESNPVFKKISEEYVSHRLAVFAANLLLDTYNLQGEIGQLNAQVDVFLAKYTQQRDPAFHALLIKLKKQANFKKCQGVERKQKAYLKAARCYLTYARQFPNSEDKDKAFYNAALNYERERKIEEAIQARLKIVNEVSDSPLVPKVLFQIAGNLHALAIYSKAAQAYEFFARKFPKDERAKDAARTAASFYEGLGQFDKAIVNYKLFLTLQKEKSKKAEVFFSIGRIYETQEQWKWVISHFEKFLRTYGAVAETELVIEAYVHIGNARMKGKHPDSRKAQRAYAAAFKAFEKLSAAEKKALTHKGYSAVAEARFKTAEAVFRTFKKTKLSIHPYRNVKTYVKKMSEKIKAKTLLVQKARALYMEVIKYRSANWAIAALGRIGEMFQQLAEDIYGLPAPGSFNEEQKEIFKGAMGDKARIPETKGIDAYVTCNKKAQELRWINEWSDLCQKQLARLDSRHYRYNAELRARPVHFGRAVAAQPLIGYLAPEEQ